MRWIGLLCLLTAGALLSTVQLSSTPGPQEDAGDRQPTRLEPRRSRSETVYLPRGSHNLLLVLQQFSDISGKVVYVKENIAPDAEVTVQKTLNSLDEKTMKAILARSGFQMTWVKSYRDESAYIVLPRITPPTGKRGRLVRQTDEPADDEEPGGRSRAAITGIEEGVRIFERIDGSTRTYLVQFETRSRAEAEEIARTVSLIHKDRRRGDKEP